MPESQAAIVIVFIAIVVVSCINGQTKTNAQLKTCEAACPDHCISTVADAAHQAAFTSCVNGYTSEVTATHAAANCAPPAVPDADACKRHPDQPHPSSNPNTGQGLDDKYFNCTRNCKHTCSESCVLDTSAPFVADWRLCTGPAMKATLQAIDDFRRCVTKISA